MRITGWIDGEQVREEILAARALVLPSFAEGLPVVIMEAMALRRPIISTFVAGIPELVMQNEHGWLVPAGDVEELAKAMKACLDAPIDKLTRMGESAHRRVVAQHDSDTQAAALAHLFENSVKSHLHRCSGSVTRSGLPSKGKMNFEAAKLIGAADDTE